ncbi:hypothetical protein B0H16DRAFT_1778510 [Mycena metata]|uniref:Uncharacterized protein n=1 Tax=Mycena metata TaxID=1033252 RepID=A0AAD7HU41_9AGAR|nr:hypothetical protein B0H16DRAFT_1778510 [Mycena metata]
MPAVFISSRVNGAGRPRSRAHLVMEKGGTASPPLPHTRRRLHRAGNRTVEARAYRPGSRARYPGLPDDAYAACLCREYIHRAESDDPQHSRKPQGARARADRVPSHSRPSSTDHRRTIPPPLNGGGPTRQQVTRSTTTAPTAANAEDRAERVGNDELGARARLQCVGMRMYHACRFASQASSPSKPTRARERRGGIKRLRTTTPSARWQGQACAARRRSHVYRVPAALIKYTAARAPERLSGKRDSAAQRKQDKEWMKGDTYIMLLTCAHHARGTNTRTWPHQSASSTRNPSGAVWTPLRETVFLRHVPRKDWPRTYKKAHGAHTASRECMGADEYAAPRTPIGVSSSSSPNSSIISALPPSHLPPFWKTAKKSQKKKPKRRTRTYITMVLLAPACRARVSLRWEFTEGVVSTNDAKTKTLTNDAKTKTQADLRMGRRAAHRWIACDVCALEKARGATAAHLATGARKGLDADIPRIL